MAEGVGPAVEARNRIVTALKSIPRLVRGRILLVLVALLIGLLVVFLAVGGFDDPTWAGRFFGPAEKLRVLEFLGVAMGGVLLAIGAVIAHKRAVALEDAAKAQARAAEAQAGAATAQAEANKGAEDGRRQERLKNAIEHLGHASDSVRLGGAYELFHLAKDTEDLRQTVLDILCAHIRRTTGEAEYRKRHEWEPSEEIQSLLTLLFVQEHEVFRGCSINLQGSWLNRAELAHARLQGANLSGGNLQRARLDNAHLQRADLSVSHLQMATFHFAYLQEATLFGVHMQGAILSQTQMQGANLAGAFLQKSVLSRVHLQGADLSVTQMQGARLFESYLQGAEFSEVRLQGASLSGAQLQGATSLARKWPFSEHIRTGIGRESDLSRAVFAGSLSREGVDFLVQGVPGGAVDVFRRELEPHIGKPASNELPEGSGAITGAYTEEEAERWIAEYEEAMRGVPEAERA